MLVLTPEKLDIVSRTNPRILDGTALFVIDEAHVVGQGLGGARIEMLLARLRRRFAGSRFILLSDRLSDDAMRRLAAWLRCGGAVSGTDGIIAADWRPTAQRVAKLEWARGGCSLAYEPTVINLRRREVIDSPIAPSEFRCKDQRTGRSTVRKFPAPERGEIAAELAFRYSVLGPVMVYAASSESVESVARKMRERVRLAKGTVDGIPPHFEDRGRLSASVSAEWLGSRHAVTRLLRSGIAVHHGGLPHALRRAIESDVGRGEIRAAVATSTIFQGVDLPARTIIVHSCRRRGGEGGRSERMHESEYWNLAGRAGRAGHETEGTVIHVVMTPSDEADFDHYASARDIYVDAGGGLRRPIADLAQGNASDGDLARAMDPDMLGIMAEEEARGGHRGAAREAVAGSLAAQGMLDSDVKKACGRTESRARSMGHGAPEAAGAGMLRACSGTDLSMHSCARLISYVDENEKVLRRLLAPEGAAGSLELARRIMDALGGVSEMDGELEYGGGDRDALLRLWMGGETVHGALEMMGAPDEDAEEAARFVGTAFGHYMPWGASAFVRIAAARLGMPEDSLPDHARYLSEMIRHGVPAPEHSWAMMLGVADKPAVMGLCERLRPSTPREMARMISEMGIEDLTKHGIGVDQAVRVAEVALRTEPNPLLREGRSLEYVLGRPARIVGVGREQWYASRLAVGDDVEVGRDYDRPADRNAMEAHARGRHIGYIERNVAQYLAPLVDAGMELAARVVREERGGDGAAPPTVEVMLSARGGHGARRGQGRRGSAAAARRTPPGGGP